MQTKITFYAAFIALCLSATAQNIGQPEPSGGGAQNSVQNSSKFVLADGTPVRLRTRRDVSSADARVGDLVELEVLDEVKVEDTIVIAKGCSGLAIVTIAEPKKTMGRGGKLDIGIDSVKLADGSKTALRAEEQRSEHGNQNSIVAAMAANSVSSAPLIFVRGKDAAIPQGTEFTAYVDGAISLDLANFQPRAMEAKAAGTSLANSATEIYFSSFPNTSEIQIDGKYVATTPATVVVRSGQHELVIRRHGFTTWQQTVTTAGEKLVFNVRLQPDDSTGSTISNCFGPDCADIPLGDVAKQKWNPGDNH